MPETASTQSPRAALPDLARLSFLALAAWFALYAAASLLQVGDVITALALPPLPPEDGRGWSAQEPFEDARHALHRLGGKLAVLGPLPLVFLVIHGIRSGDGPSRTAALASFALLDVFLLLLVWQERAYAAGLPPAPPDPLDDLMAPALLGAFAVLAWPRARARLPALTGWALVAVPTLFPWWDFHLGALTLYVRPGVFTLATLGFGLLAWAFLSAGGLRRPTRKAGEPDHDPA